MIKLILVCIFPLSLVAQNFTGAEIERWEKQAKKVTIIRDHFGIPHIYGNTDADAVFGLLYAQCEDDFKRVEMNYLEKLGALSLVKGESAIYNDLLIRLVIDQDEARADYMKAPLWLKKLCNAFADAVNYYIYKHPGVKTVTGKAFEPWYPFLWTDGSIGAISTADINIQELRSFYSGEKNTSSVINPSAESEQILTGSNGFAFSPRITSSGNTILWINPHVTFYFRPEVHMVSNEGLNVYGAVTWGQFFIYQGFNENGGWMHTSSGVDAADSYIENLSSVKGKWFYQYDGKEIPVKEKKISIQFQSGQKNLESKTFTALFTQHGPVMANRNGQYISLRADNRIANGLIQCWERTKTKNFASFQKSLDLKGNISNNTVYADKEGNIAYWHGNRVPVRDTNFNWNLPVDGTIKATQWKGYHAIADLVKSINPPNGWIQNCNSTPYTVAGKNSPGKNNYPSYMAPDAENFRGINAVRVLSEEKNYTMEKVMAAGYDTRLASFEVLVPALIRAFENNVRKEDSLYTLLGDAMAVLKNWDFRCNENSIATTLAVEWGTQLTRLVNKQKRPDIRFDYVDKTKYFVATTSPMDLLYTFLAALYSLDRSHHTWKVKWGDINRFQRISGDINEKYTDSLASIPVGFVSSYWGCLPSYTSSYFSGTKKRYGINGNSFVCVVEFGKRIKAKSLLAGGESSDPSSPHFFDQAEMYSKGLFKDVLFYKEDVLKNAEHTYHPGQ